MTRELTVRAERLPENRILGFRMNWIEADDQGHITASLDTGAGLGSPILSLQVYRDGKHLATETIDVRDLLKVWLKGMIEDPQPEVTGEPGDVSWESV